MKNDPATASDIRLAALLIQEFVAGLDFERFSADRKTQSPVLHQLMIMGEASKRLSSEFRDKHSEIQWTEIARMRDRCIHHYNEVDVAVVWRTVTRDVVHLLAYLNRELMNG